MAYEPKTWACGDTITADDLNHIEQGVAEAGGGGGGLDSFDVIQTGESQYTSSMSYSDLDDYMNEHGHFPVCNFDLVQHFYVGNFIADAPPYIDGRMFVGLRKSNNSTVTMESVIIKTNDDITVGTVSLA